MGWATASPGEVPGLTVLTAVSLLEARFTQPAELAAAVTKRAAQHFRV